MDLKDSVSNLLFGALALEEHYIDTDQYNSAIEEYCSDKSRPITTVLSSIAAMTAEQQKRLSAQFQQRMQRNNGDPVKCLAREVKKFAESSNTFERVREIGHGATAIVWEARDAFGRSVALKELTPRASKRGGSDRMFWRESEIAASLSHPNIPAVYARGRFDDGRPFYAMQLVGKPSLRSIYQDPPTDHEERKENEERRSYNVADYLQHTLHANDSSFSASNLEAALRRFCDVCHAVEFAHTKEILHCDVKPANICLDEKGGWMLLDWGLSHPGEVPENKTFHFGEEASGKAEEDWGDDVEIDEGPRHPAHEEGSSGQQSKQKRYGTPQYMAPEQAKGEPPSKQTDVFGLGATLYEILSGSCPYDGISRAEIIEKAATATRKSVSFLNAKVPTYLDRICQRATDSDPQVRYGSAQELADDIGAFLEHRPIAAWPNEPKWRRIRRKVEKNRRALGIWATIAGAIVGIIFSLWIWDSRNDIETIRIHFGARNILLNERQNLLEKHERILQLTKETAVGILQAVQRENIDTNKLRSDLLLNMFRVVDAIESDMGIPMDLPEWEIDFLLGKYAVLASNYGEGKHRLDRAWTQAERCGVDPYEESEIVSQLARVYQYEKEMDEAEELHLEAYNLRKNPDPDDFEHRRLECGGIHNLGQFELETGNLGNYYDKEPDRTAMGYINTAITKLTVVYNSEAVRGRDDLRRRIALDLAKYRLNKSATLERIAQIESETPTKYSLIKLARETAEKTTKDLETEIGRVPIGSPEHIEFSWLLGAGHYLQGSLKLRGARQLRLPEHVCNRLIFKHHVKALPLLQSAADASPSVMKYRQWLAGCHLQIAQAATDDTESIEYHYKVGRRLVEEFCGVAGEAPDPASVVNFAKFYAAHAVKFQDMNMVAQARERLKQLQHKHDSELVKEACDAAASKLDKAETAITEVTGGVTREVSL